MAFADLLYAMRGRRGVLHARASLIGALTLAPIATGCELELSPTVEHESVIIEGIEWPDTVLVGDSLTLRVRLRRPGDPTSIYPQAALDWAISNEFLLRLVEVDSFFILGFPEISAVGARLYANFPGVVVVRVSLPPSNVLLSAEPLLDTIRIAQNWFEVYAGRRRTCAWPNDLYFEPPLCWGDGTSAALGTGNAADVLLPRETTYPSGIQFSPAVAFGESHGCAVMTAEVRCVGSNAWGQLGLGRAGDVAMPTLVGSDELYRGVVAGARHTCAFVVFNPFTNVQCWGDNRAGQLGTSEPRDACPASGELACSLSPVTVFGEFMGSLSAGDEHTCGVSVEQVARCWGSNALGQLGAGSTVASRASPAPVAGERLFTTVVSGRSHACALTVAGRAYCWGSNQYGQLGVGTATLERCGTTDCALAPVPVAGDLQFQQISAGGDETCGIATSGAAYCWGANDRTQLGSGFTFVQCGDRECARLPRLVWNTGLLWRQLAVGSDHVCGRTQRNELYCWGSNARGQLGIGGSQPSRAFEPTRVSDPG